jgi:hypothetical protein
MFHQQPQQTIQQELSPGKLERYLSVSWLQQLAKIAQCKRGCTKAVKNRAEALRQEYQSVRLNVLLYLSAF